MLTGELCARRRRRRRRRNAKCYRGEIHGWWLENLLVSYTLFVNSMEHDTRWCFADAQNF